MSNERSWRCLDRNDIIGIVDLLVALGIRSPTVNKKYWGIWSRLMSSGFIEEWSIGVLRLVSPVEVVMSLIS
jgi:hypothetical protein